MRADRLLSLLMLLQIHGKLPAHQLAKELEVTERTIYRDVEALSMAGIPVYGEPGREGGFALWTTTAPPSPACRTHKCGRCSCSPSPRLWPTWASVRKRAPRFSKWPPRCQATIATTNAASASAFIWMRWDGTAAKRPSRTCKPSTRRFGKIVRYGLPTKSGRWPLIWSNGSSRTGWWPRQAFGTWSIGEARRCASIAFPGCWTRGRPKRPSYGLVDFDLAAFWQDWCAEQERSRFFYSVAARISPQLLPQLPRLFGDRLRDRIAEAGPADAEGWITLELAFELLEAARDRLLSLGSSVEVLAPRACAKPGRLCQANHGYTAFVSVALNRSCSNFDEAIDVASPDCAFS